MARPAQILPIAILWYDLGKGVSFDFPTVFHEPEQVNGRTIQVKPIVKKPSPSKSVDLLAPLPNKVIQHDLKEVPVASSIATITPTKYPNQFMSPQHRLQSYSSLYTSFSDRSQSIQRQDLVPTAPPETIPLSAQKPAVARSQSEVPLSSDASERKKSKTIPFDSTAALTDPRLTSSKAPRTTLYLESSAVQRVVKQQQRLNQYCTSNKNSVPKTAYRLIPLIAHPVSLVDRGKTNPSSSSEPTLKTYIPLDVSVIDCLQFGFKVTGDEQCIDLEQHENRSAYAQIKTSNQLIEQEKRLSSRELRLRWREKRLRRLQEHELHAKKCDSSASSSELAVQSAMHTENGRKLLDEHRLTASPNRCLSTELVHFFAYEYHHETRLHVKRLLAEVIGVLAEKYELEPCQTATDTECVEGQWS